MSQNGGDVTTDVTAAADVTARALGPGSGPSLRSSADFNCFNCRLGGQTNAFAAG